MRDFVTGIPEYLWALFFSGAAPVGFFLIDVVSTLAILDAEHVKVSPQVTLASLLFGLIAGNFLLYQKLRPGVSAHDVLIEPYNPRDNFNAAQFKYFGPTPIRDVAVSVHVVATEDGQTIDKMIDRFYAESDLSMTEQTTPLTALQPQQGYRCRVPSPKPTARGHAVITIQFTEARIGRRLAAKQTIDLPTWTLPENDALDLVAALVKSRLINKGDPKP